MSLHVVRLGSPRLPGEQLRIGTVRRPPRGVRKEDVGRLGFYDVWLPELAPSAELVSRAHATGLDGKAWQQFARRYRSEMRRPLPQRLLALLAGLSAHTELAVGCYCEDPARCHRSLLAELLREAGARLA